MIYRHRFQVRAPLERVRAFHRQAASLAAITPPPISARIGRAPAVLAEGDEMELTLGLGPLGLRWLARIESVTDSGFSDRQISGPFATWVHRHGFVALDGHTTLVTDEVNLRLRAHPAWWLIGMGMRLGLPLLFAYRAWKTRRLLS